MGNEGSVSARPNNKEDNIDYNKAATRTREVADAPLPKNQKFSYRDALLKDGISAENADRLLANRKANNLKNTEAAYNKLMGALEQVCNGLGVTHDEAIEFASKKGWGFIDPSWDLRGLTAKRARRTMRAISVEEYIKREMANR